MTDVVFAFDVEDVYNAESDDALLQLCRVFADEGVPLSLFVAGEKARTIRQRGRRDVIEAMGEHEICYHGNYWGDFPEPATRYGAIRSTLRILATKRMNDQASEAPPQTAQWRVVSHRVAS